MRGRRHLNARGFTLVEVLVALLVMAILAALAWQGLDGITRARSSNNEALDRTLRLNTAVTQWEQDLIAVQNLGAIVPPLAFDGQTLRLTRRTEGGVILVAWAVRGGVWQRWTTPPLKQVGELQEAWLRSQQLLGNEAGQITVAEASTWQVYFYRGNSWSNAQSTGDRVVVSSAGANPLPKPDPKPDVKADPKADPKADVKADPNANPNGGANPNPNPNPTPSPQLPTPGTGGEVLPQAVRMVITLGSGTLTRDIALGPTGGS